MTEQPPPSADLQPTTTSAPSSDPDWGHKHQYNPPSLPAVVDYTERARGLAKFLWELWERSNAAPHLTIKDGAHHIKLALSAVASEYQAEIERLQVQYQRDSIEMSALYEENGNAKAALLARLREPEIREAALKAVMEKKRGGRPPSSIELVDAALAVITEKLI